MNDASAPHAKRPDDTPEDGAPDSDESRATEMATEELVEAVEKVAAASDTTVAEQLRELHMLVATQHAADVHGMTQMLGSKRHLLFVNFMTGVARGVGFFLGATLIGALIIGAGAYFLDASAEAVGLKDVTTRRLVGTLYSKFHEIRSVIDDLEEETEKLGSAEKAAEKIVDEAEAKADADVPDDAEKDR